MSTEREAGQLILAQLKIFNEAAVLFENVISVSIYEGIDECVRDFADNNDWSGKYRFHIDDRSCWLAPKQWITNPGEDKPERKAWFNVGRHGDDDYWTASFCRVATQGGEAGFFFETDPACFGGPKAWKACVPKFPKEVITKLEGLGFRNERNGIFFLPVLLNNQSLAQSWLDNGKFAHDDDSFAPLRNALEKLKDAVPLFDGIMKGCVPASPAKD
jgi:hypothetical protein